MFCTHVIWAGQNDRKGFRHFRIQRRYYLSYFSVTGESCMMRCCERLVLAVPHLCFTWGPGGSSCAALAFVNPLYLGIWIWEHKHQPTSALSKQKGSTYRLNNEPMCTHTHTNTPMHAERIKHRQTMTQLHKDTQTNKGRQTPIQKQKRTRIDRHKQKVFVSRVIAPTEPSFSDR